MAGKSPAEAVQNYLDPLNKAISCITNSVLTVSGGYHATTGSSSPHALALNDGLPVRLSGIPHLHLSILQNYRIIEFDGPRGPWKVTIVAYNYSLKDDDDHEVLYHYHPAGKITFPHVHMRTGGHIGSNDLTKAHFPTSRVAVEDVLRFAIDELGAEHQRADYADVLNNSQAAFDDFKTWA